MPKSEILYVKGMNMSESEIDEVEEDIWDDRKLNDAYDKALKIANAEVAKRIAMSTNTQEKEHSKMKKEKQASSSRPSSSKNTHKSGVPWKVGMSCRAIYEGDGIEYEAVILRIIDKECVVRFLGYDNSEIVLVSSLKPSLGKEERTRQIELASLENADEGFMSQPTLDRMECGSERDPSPGSTERSFQKAKKRPSKKKSHKQSNSFELPQMPFPMPNLPMMKNLGSIDLPMPPPPPITMPASDRDDAEEQAISSMLLSWYMSGYYTGLYQGLKRSKSNRRNV